MFLPLGMERKRYGVRALGFLDGRLADHTAPMLAGPTDTAFDDVRTGAILRQVVEAKRADVLDLRHLRARVDDRRNPLVNSRTERASDRRTASSSRGSGKRSARIASRANIKRRAGAV